MLNHSECIVNSSLFRLSHLNNDKGGDKKTGYGDYQDAHYRIEYSFINLNKFITSIDFMFDEVRIPY